MRFALIISVTIFSFSAFSQTNHERVQNLTKVSRIAFGSCNDQNDEQPLWPDMLAQKPDLFIWGGDNIYADWGKSESVARAYKIQNENPGYRNFKNATPMIGIWDDHDYAFNNAGGDVVFKKDSQKMHLDFFDVPADSPRRLQEGIYYSMEKGTEEEKIKFIMLDNRYFKNLDPKAPMLGETQWLWLENEFKTSTAKLHIIAAGLPIFSPLIPYTEEWREKPMEVTRLLDLLKKYQVKAPVFLTGDKHFSSIYQFSGQLEFMSSGMTHVADRRTWWYLGRKFPVTYFGLSYGIIDVAWEKDVPLLDLYIRNGKKDIHRKKVIWKNNTWVNR